MTLCRVLLACIKYLSKCPCPRCLIKKAHIPSTGTKADTRRRSDIRVDNNLLQKTISNACEWIFVKGIGVAAKWIQDTLGPKSQMPIQVRNKSYCSCCTAPITYAMSLQSAFSTRMSSQGFNVYSIFVVDLLHKFELGVWKAVFTHLLRVLHAEGQDKIQILNTRLGITIRCMHAV